MILAYTCQHRLHFEKNEVIKSKFLFLEGDGF